MCEVCEGKAPIKTELKMKYCSVESIVVGIESGAMKMSALVQEVDRLPYVIEAKFDCDFCPKCGERLKK